MCIVDRYEDGYFVARTEFDSPDVDNTVLIDAKKTFLAVGTFVYVEIVEASDFDLYGRVVEGL
jgi:ribosomal protein S12 methylthiotransferase